MLCRRVIAVGNEADRFIMIQLGGYIFKHFLFIYNAKLFATAETFVTICGEFVPFLRIFRIFTCDRIRCGIDVLEKQVVVCLSALFSLSLQRRWNLIFG